MSSILRVHVRVSLAATLVLFATGCYSNNIRMSSDDTLVPAGRVRLQVEAPYEPSAIGLAFSGIVVEGEVSYMTERDTQSLTATSDIELNDQVFSGPGEMKVRAQVVDATAHVRGGLAVFDVFRLEPLAGFQATTVDLELQSSGVQASDLSTSVGLQLGLRAGLQPHERFELYGQGTAGLLIGGRDSNHGIWNERAEVGARLLPFDHFGLFAGYRWTKIRQDRDPDEDDSVIRLNGPVFGMELRFE